jgi:hypothetical protein
MTAMWAVKDGSGRIVSSFGSRSRLELANKLMGERCDTFRLQVSSSYRQLFDRALAKVLDRENWQIVRVRVRQRAVLLRSADPPVELETDGRNCGGA